MDVARAAGKMQTNILWSECREHLLWRELVSCILGSRVVFESARSATDHLGRVGLLRIARKEHSYSIIQKRIASELAKKIYLPRNHEGGYSSYRYPNARAYQICNSAKNIYGRGMTLRALLKESQTDHEARLKLISTACGIGPKQSSLFLRNIGFTEDLAIVDTHVLRYMHLLRMIQSVPDAIGTLRQYEKFERKLQDYSVAVRTRMSVLDTAIWIVMRVYQREFVS